MMNIIVIVGFVFLHFAQAEETWDDMGDEWAKTEKEWPTAATHTSEPNEWHDQMYGSASFSTIFFPLMLASFVVARLVGR